MADNEKVIDADEMASSTSAVNQASIDEAWARATDNMQTERVSIQALLDKAGVTSEDFQAVCNQHPELIQHVGGGATCRVLGDVATSVKNEYIKDKNGRKKIKTGNCHTGVIAIHTKANAIVKKSKNPDIKDAMTDSLLTQEAKQAELKYRRERPYQGGSNGGCSEVAMFQASDDYVTIAVPNAAYGKTKGCDESKQLNQLFYGVQSGVTITIDSIEDKKVRQKQGNTPGGKWGHCAVKRRDGNFACDFVQTSIDFSRYGEYVHACFPKDADVPKEYAQMLIEQAQIRMCSIEQTQIVGNAQTPVQGQTQTPIEPNAPQPVHASTTISASDLMSQRGELAENKNNRESVVVALKSGRVDGNVDFRDAKKDLDKTDERPVQEVLRDGRNTAKRDEAVAAASQPQDRGTSSVSAQSNQQTKRTKYAFKLSTLSNKNVHAGAQTEKSKPQPVQDSNVKTLTIQQLQAYLRRRQGSK